VLIEKHQPQNLKVCMCVCVCTRDGVGVVVVIVVVGVVVVVVVVVVRTYVRAYVLHFVISPKRTNSTSL